MRVPRSLFQTTAECYKHYGNTNSSLVRSVCDLIDINKHNDRLTTTAPPSPPTATTSPAEADDTTPSKDAEAFDNYSICRKIYVELQSKANEQARHYQACRAENRQCHTDYRALFDKTNARHSQTVQSEQATKTELKVHQAKLDLVNKQLVAMDLANNATSAELARARAEKTALTAQVSRLTAIVAVKHTAAEACSVDLKEAQTSATATKIQLARVLANNTHPDDFASICPITHDRLVIYYAIFALACTIILILLIIAACYAVKHHRLLRRSQALLARAEGYVGMHDFNGPPDCPTCRANTGMANPSAAADANTGTATINFDDDVNPTAP